MSKQKERKLTEAQIRALQYLRDTDWEAPWWGGKPHSGFPKQISSKSLDYILHNGLARVFEGPRPLWKTVSITDTGRTALESKQ